MPSTDSIRVNVTVTPNVPNGNDVPISAAGTSPYVQQNGDINLQRNQAYDITFNLAAANGVRNWNPNTPFANQSGSCPQAGQGPSSPCSLNGGGNPNSITIHVDPQPNPSSFLYRLNYNDSYYSDPIIIIG